jgi:hypothetical protein
MSRPSSHRPIGSATGRSQVGRMLNVYFQTARVPPSTAAKRQPPPNVEKNHGPLRIVIPTCSGGLQETYSLTIANPCRERV